MKQILLTLYLCLNLNIPYVNISPVGYSNQTFFLLTSQLADRWREVVKYSSTEECDARQFSAKKRVGPNERRQVKITTALNTSFCLLDVHAGLKNRLELS